MCESKSGAKLSVIDLVQEWLFGAIMGIQIVFALHNSVVFKEGREVQSW